MAIIVPFADPSAHGSVADSFSFRRRFNTVVFQKKPEPKQPNSAGQLAQREKFKQAAEDWYYYDEQSKDYFRERAKQLGMTARNLFLHAKLRNIMPSQIVTLESGCENAQIINVRATQNQGVLWGIRNLYWGAYWGRVWDTENIYEKEASTSPMPGAIFIQALNESIEYHFRDGIVIKFFEKEEMIVRIPQTKLNIGENISYYLSTDGSSFFDMELTHLAATNNF